MEIKHETGLFKSIYPYDDYGVRAIACYIICCCVSAPYTTPEDVAKYQARLFKCSNGAGYVDLKMKLSPGCEHLRTDRAATLWIESAITYKLSYAGVNFSGYSGWSKSKQSYEMRRALCGAKYAGRDAFGGSCSFLNKVGFKPPASV
jgi:hypothetical protein